MRDTALSEEKGGENMKMTLKAARVNAGLTQEEAAKSIGVTKNTIYRWEIGVSSPPFKRLHTICEVYGVDSLDDLIFLPK